MEIQTYLLIGIVMAASCALQSAVGFGFGLFAVPLILLLGLEPQQAIPLIAVNAWVQIITGMIHHRQQLEWRKVAGWIALAVAMQPIGVWVLSGITTLDAGQIRQVFGVMVLLALGLQWWAKPRPRPRLHPGWAFLAMPSAGLMSGVAGMPGPPVVLWVMAHDWSADRMRMTMWSIFLVLAPANLLFMGMRFGDVVWTYTVRGTFFIPLVLLGALPGLWLGAKIPSPLLRRIAFGLLLLICLFSILQPIVAPGLMG